MHLYSPLIYFWVRNQNSDFFSSCSSVSPFANHRRDSFHLVLIVGFLQATLLNTTYPIAGFFMLTVNESPTSVDWFVALASNAVPFINIGWLGKKFPVFFFICLKSRHTSLRGPLYRSRIFSRWAPPLMQKVEVQKVKPRHFWHAPV